MSLNLSLQERINRLQDATAAGSQLEQLMLREPVSQVTPNGTANPGSGRSFVVLFESARVGIMKTFAGQSVPSCRIYRQDRYDAIVHEVVAWRLAQKLGGRWERMVPTAVLRDIATAGSGVLLNWRDGTPDPTVLSEAAGQVAAAAFWDALIGQQDRHARNYRYDASNRRLALIDNAFAFARDRDFFHSSYFLAHRRQKLGLVLSARESEALERMLDEDLYGLRYFLADDRAEALCARATRMFRTGKLPLPGAF